MLWQNYLKYVTQAFHDIHMLYDCTIVLGDRRMESYIDPLRAKLKWMDTEEAIMLPPAMSKLNQLHPEQL